MKLVVAAIILSFSLLSHANVIEEMTENLRETLSAELSELDGDVSSLKCTNTFVGVVCPSVLEFPQEKCEETYYYLGFGLKVYERLCSTCSFNRGKEIYRSTCKN